RTMNCPAAASPGGESGVSTPILIGACAKAGAASAAAATAASRAVLKALSMVTVLRRESWGARNPHPMRAGAPAARVIRLREALHESPIGLGERVRRQCGALGPAHLLPLLRARLAVERAAEEENAHRFLRVAPGHGLHQVAHRSVHPELFPEFATERRPGGLG